MRTFSIEQMTQRINSLTRIARRLAGRTWFAVVVAAIVLSIQHIRAAVADDAPAAEVEILPEADQMMFAKSLEKAVKDGDMNALNDLIDWNQIVDTATSGETTPVINRARADFKGGFIKSIKQGVVGSFAERMIQNSKDGGTYKFLRLSQIENEPIAVFRLKSANQGGANYHQYFLKRSKDGLVRAQDFYIFLSAERISETTRRIWQPLAIEVSKTLVDKLTKPVDPVISKLHAIQAIQKMVAAGQGAQALTEYRKLPETVQQEKLLLIFRLQAAQQVSEKEYGLAIEDYRKFHPGDAALDFILIDGYALQKEFEKSLECIDRTNEALGGDAYLLALRANALSHLGRNDEAWKAVNEALKIEPDLLDAHLSALSISLDEKKHALTAKYLNAIERDLGLSIGDLTQIAEYADFVKSPEYKTWMASRK